MADNQITPFQLTDQFTMDNFNQRINETNTALQKKADTSSVYTKEESISAETRTALSLAETATPDAALAEIARQLSESKGVSMESVWANAAPTSTFDPQFVSCDLSDADFICIKAATNPTASDAGYHTEEYLFYGKTANSMVLQPCNFSETKSEGMAVAQRSISISDTGIDFGDGGYKVTWSDTYKKSVSNVYAIPLEIFKVKGIA